MPRSIIDLTVIGRPAPQPRPRVFRSGGVATDSKASRKWKREVKRAAKAAGFAPAMPAEPLEMVVQFEMPIARKAMHGRHHTGRPDCDNLAKAILDALQDVGVIDDDSQVCRCQVSKVYGPAPGRAVVRLAALT
jgi:Holliday junction resolvase RusA-like endonuclease